MEISDAVEGVQNMQIHQQSGRPLFLFTTK